MMMTYHLQTCICEMEPQSPVVPLVLCDQHQELVHIDVGGVHYNTTLTTLTRFPESKLAKLFNGTLPIAWDLLSLRYFLDMNGLVFAHILDYLRHVKLLLPRHFDQLPLLLQQAQQLEIIPLIEELKAISEEEKVEDNPESNAEESAASNESVTMFKQKRRRSKRDRVGGRQMGRLLTIVEEGFQGLIKEVQQMMVKQGEKGEGMSINEGLHRLTLDDERKMDTIIKEKDEERMDHLMKTFRECLKELLSENKNIMEKIIKENADMRLKEDEKMETLMKTFSNSFKELINSNESKMEKNLKEGDDKTQKEVKDVNKLVKSLDERCQSLLEDVDKKENVKLPHQNQIQQTVS